APPHAGPETRPASAPSRPDPAAVRPASGRRRRADEAGRTPPAAAPATHPAPSPGRASTPSRPPRAPARRSAAWPAPPTRTAPPWPAPAGPDRPATAPTPPARPPPAHAAPTPHPDPGVSRRSVAQRAPTPFWPPQDDALFGDGEPIAASPQGSAVPVTAARVAEPLPAHRFRADRG